MPKNNLTAHTHAVTKAFAKKMRENREEIRLSKRELARRVGTTVPTICKIESATQNPSLPMAMCIAWALGFTKGDLVELMAETEPYVFNG
jgi:DNA-binding XRE family transcriptional regulator